MRKALLTFPGRLWDDNDRGIVKVVKALLVLFIWAPIYIVVSILYTFLICLSWLFESRSQFDERWKE